MLFCNTFLEIVRYNAGDEFELVCIGAMCGVNA